MRLKDLLAFTCCCCIGVMSHSQEYRILHWGIENGLSQGINQKIIKDKDGFIWATSYEGVNRFDGKSFQNFYSSPGKRNAIKGTETIGLVVDSLGKIWVGSGEGLNRYDPVTDSVISFEPRNKNTGRIKYVVPIIATGNEVICLDINNELIGYETRNFYRRLITSQIRWFNDYSNVNNSWFDKKKNELWMPAEFGLARVKINSGKTEFFWTDEHINAIEYLSGDTMLLGTKDGLLKWAISNNSSQHIEKIGGSTLGKVTCINSDEAGYWVGTEEHGLFRVMRNGDVRHLSKSNEQLNSIDGNKINTIYSDNNGIVWISVGTNGIDQLIPGHRFRHYSENPASNNSLSNNIVRCFMEDAQHNIWIATQGGGLNIYNPAQQKFSALTTNNLPGLPFNLIRFMVRDGENSGLIGTEKGMCRLDLRQLKAERIKFVDIKGSQLRPPYIEQITPYGDSAWLIATKEFGLFELKKESKTCTQLPFPGNKHVFYVALINNLLFVSIWDDDPRIFRIEEKKWTEIRPDLSAFLVTYVLYVPDSKRYWIGTLKGLLEVDENLKIIRQYTTDDGLTNHYIYAMVLDKEGILWISTNKGISAFDTHSKIFSQYTPADGLQGYEYNAKAGFLAADGKIYFGGINGFDVINTRTNVSLPEDSRLYIRQLKVNNFIYTGSTDIKYTREIYLPYSAGNITISTGIIDFVMRANHQIRYKLEGADKEWKTAERDFVINYSGLAPGQYRFLGVANDKPLSSKPQVALTIFIAHPWWQSWWFTSLVIVAFLLIVVLIIRFYYNRKLEKQKILFEKQQAVEQERTRIAMEMHDDLGSGLTTIRYLAGGLSYLPPAVTKEKAEKIVSSAKSLVDNMNDIIWTMKSDNNTLDETLAYIRKQATEQLETAGIDYLVDFPKNVPVVQLSSEIKRNLLLISKEAIHNIVKHSAATSVSLSAQFGTNQLEIKIIDNGKGIDLGDVSKFGNGLKNMRKRAEEIDATFEVTNRKGTTITISAAV